MQRKGISSVIKKLSILEESNRNITKYKNCSQSINKVPIKNEELTGGFWESFPQNVTLNVTLIDDLELEAEKRKSGILQREKPKPKAWRHEIAQYMFKVWQK